MGSFDLNLKTPCSRCGVEMQLPENPDTRARVMANPVCTLCKKLGDRSLVWFGRAWAAATSDEERAEIKRRFAAARGRSWMRDDIERHIKRHGMKNLPPGILQLAREREAERR